ncbi:LysE family translocator [Halomonas sp. MCCC 1A17488]|uniref:LysE family translocator n=1 Tax=unclassified Halomonas TaxID=2609666 RepID=UPI0018D26B30|nr:MULTISPECIES: LysE family translocator [unclassified Halomonas]MCE8016161.1 LysE family translocator [Halomonas sp. MCCC 1A17488]MCG3239494.1 LysE family translocator [Halomonas sp. MCCC 1A17488]QPP50583.1 LysE family translocator [Halomonas sp. SS10-MC5]
MEHLGLFVAALAIAYLVPGPDMVLVMQTASRQGRGLALATACGLGLARGAHVALAAMGLAALLKASPLLFDFMRGIGAAYLVWLGARLARADIWEGTANPAQSPPLPRSYRLAFQRGLLTNIANPKALLFCSVLLPQFLHADSGMVTLQFALLGIVLVGVGLIFDLCYTAVGMALGRWMARHPLAQRFQRWLFAILLMGFGTKLALSS